MARIFEQPAEISEELFEAIELILFGAIGLTSFALAEASPVDLTLHQWRALVVIGRAQTIRVGEVAMQIGTPLPATSRLLSRLERRGLLASARDEQDRRVSNVWLTASGQAVRDAVILRRRRLMESALAGRGGLPQDLAGGLEALGRAFAPFT